MPLAADTLHAANTGTCARIRPTVDRKRSSCKACIAPGGKVSTSGCQIIATVAAVVQRCPVDEAQPLALPGANRCAALRA